jgi:prepilin-type N-terminal cleavage/methylation domain-containing protein
MMRNQKGFTLIELMIVVVIIGIVAAVAGPQFLKYISRAENTEVVLNLKSMTNGAKSYFTEIKVNQQGETVPKQFPLSVGPTPGNTACRDGASFKHEPRDFNNQGGFGADSWVALAFSVDKPFYFQYTFQSAGSGSASNFTALAEGDLDCDNLLSEFYRVGRVEGSEVEIRPMYSRRETE